MASLPPGLTVLPDVLDAEGERALLAAIDAAPWDDTLKRRVQHYGHRYVYAGASADAQTAPVPPCPAWARDLLAAVPGVPAVAPEDLQIIVNAYDPGQGIAAHVDDPRRLGPWVLTVSLGSAATMRFKKQGVALDVPLRPREALLLTGEARYAWSHEIPARKSDVVEGRRVPRGRRVSVTFRAMAR